MSKQEVNIKWLSYCYDLPVLCSAVDSRYAHLQYLKQTEQREIEHEELINQMESLAWDRWREGTDSTKCTEADGPPTKRSKSCKKDSTMQFLLGTLWKKQSINTSTDELDHFMKMPALDPDSNVLEWWKTNAERLPTLSRVAGQLLCIPGTPVPSERINSTSGNIVT